MNLGHPLLADPLVLFVFGLGFVVNGLTAFFGLRSGRVPYGWFFFVPLMTSRQSNPVLYWLVILLYVGVAATAGVFVVSGLIRAVGLTPVV